jgi:hypothetical protein
VNVFHLKQRSEKFDDDDDNNNNKNKKKKKKKKKERIGIKKFALSLFYTSNEIILNFNKVTVAIESSN